MTETDLQLSDGRTLHIYDTGPGADDRLAVFWHHGTPNTGAPPAPLFPTAARLGIRWVSHDRPSYGPSTPRRGRAVASVAEDVASVADALGIERFALMGHSGGGPHALACAALLPERVLAVVSMSSLAPRQAKELDWFAGMGPFGDGQLHAAVAGRVALEGYLASTEWDPHQFTAADHAALAGEWSWIGDIAGQAMAGGPYGLVDDNLAFVAPWGFDLGLIRAPALIVHGGQDRVVPSAHGQWLASQIPDAELWLRPDAGHISILDAGAAALEWLHER